MEQYLCEKTRAQAGNLEKTVGLSPCRSVVLEKHMLSYF